jgi:hypothetical protein
MVPLQTKHWNPFGELLVYLSELTVQDPDASADARNEDRVLRDPS